MRRPNILILLTDQRYHGMMSCAGHPWRCTPNMDKLANEGVRFTLAYVTNPVCVPSCFSLGTGRMPSAIGRSASFSSHAKKAAKLVETAFRSRYDAPKRYEIVESLGVGVFVVADAFS